MDFNSFRQGKSVTDGSTIKKDTMNNENILNVEETINTYSKLSNDEMMRALFDEVNKEKQRGVFNIENIKEFYKNISPMLDNQSREKMRAIIESIGRN